MPELPEVESVRLALVEAGIVEARITGVTLNYAKAVLEPSAGEFVERMQDRVVLDAGRRAKYLYFPLDEGALVVHLRMTGNLKIEAPAGARGAIAHCRVLALYRWRDAVLR